jgi:hypothetical protein
MSWGLEVSGVKASELQAAFDAKEAVILADEANTPHWTAEVREQVAASVAAALVLIESGALGSVDASYRVVISGHANEGHTAEGDTLRDSISLSVMQDAFAAPAEDS